MRHGKRERQARKRKKRTLVYTTGSEAVTYKVGRAHFQRLISNLLKRG